MARVGRRRPSHDGVSARAQTSRSLTPAAAVVMVACSMEPTQPVQSVTDARAAAIMAGRWEYTSPRRTTSEPSLGAGLAVAVDIDSVADASLYGRVTFWLAGDVGVPLDAFGPVTGSVGDANRVSLVINLADPSLSPIRVDGVLNDDRIVVDGSWRGNEPGPFPIASTFLRTAVHTNRPLPIRVPFVVRDELDDGHPTTNCPCTAVRDGGKPRLVSLALVGCDLGSAHEVAAPTTPRASEASPCQHMNRPDAAPFPAHR